jgi:sporulation protein YpjB
MSLFKFRNRAGRIRKWIRMGLAALISLVGIFAMYSPAVMGGTIKGYGTSKAPFTSFLSSTEGLYDAVTEGKLDEATTSLILIEKQFRSLPMQEITTAEGVQALAQTIAELKRAGAATTPSQEGWLIGAAALRLAADALAHPDKPIWHQYRTLLSEDLNTLSTAILPSQTQQQGAVSVPETAIQAFVRLEGHYRVIRPAVLLKSEPWLVERGDSSIRYAGRVLRADPPNADLLPSVVQPLREAMEGLFPTGLGHDAASTVVPPIASPPWGMSALLGTFIVTILTWVGWRRYKLEPYSRWKR